MSGQDDSTAWHRVRDVRPQLKSQVRVTRHRYRGRGWYVLQDGASTRHYRFGASAWHLLRSLDGRRTVGEVWDAWHDETGEEPLPKRQVIDVLGELHSGGLLQTDVMPDTRDLGQRQRDDRRARLLRKLKSPFVIRLPLLDPDDLLERCQTLARAVFGPVGLIVWVAALIGGTALTLGHWDGIATYWSGRGLTPHSLLLLVIVYPFVKGVHELAHGLAVKRWGGEVHEAGVMLLVFVPLPYVDASMANAFPDKRRRMLVSAAGILAELFLAALAVVVWVNVESGLVRDLAFSVMVIGGVSTVVFNGNPLLRFDGYYLLADTIEIPNLATRSVHYYGYLIQRYLLGVRGARSPVTARGERRWFLGYGAASAVYRLMVLTAIVLFVAEQYPVIGIALGLFAVSVQVVWPLLSKLHFLMRSPALAPHRGRAVMSASLVLAALGGALFLVPVPSWTMAEGIVWLPEKAQVRAPADAFVVRLLAREGQRVDVGTPLVATEDPLLDARIEALAWEYEALAARHAATFISDPATAAIVAGDRDRVAGELAEARADRDRLTVRSETAGVFLVPGGRHLPGRFLPRGKLIGYVTQAASPTLRTVVPQRHADIVRQRTRAVNVRFADRPGVTVPADIRLALPSADNRLPSKALGAAGGGRIAVDAEDTDGLTSIEDIFTFELTLPQGLRTPRVGTRVFVRFDHDAEPLATQVYRAVRQLLLKRFRV